MKTIFLTMAVCVSLPLHAGSVTAQQVLRLPARDAALTARPRPTFVVGAEDGRDWEVFANVGDVAFDSKDNLYILDRGNARVVAFDSTGRFLRVIGKRGNGPGEFAMAQRMTVTRGDEVVVSDIDRRVFSVFGTDGTFRRTVPFSRGWLMTGGKLSAHPRGGVLSLFVPHPAPTPSGGRVLWQPLGPAAATPLFTEQANTSVRPRVFSPTTRYTVLPGGGLAVAGSAAYSVRILAPNGSTARVLERPIAPRRVTARDREQEKERRAAFSRPGAITIIGPGANRLPSSVRVEAAQALQEVEFAAVMPAIKALETDAAGNLWIERAGPAADRPGPIDIITPQGRYVGTLAGVRLPTAFSARGRGAYVETDTNGVARVVVIRFPSRWR